MLPYSVFSLCSAHSPQTSGSNHYLLFVAVICVHVLFPLLSWKILEGKGLGIIYLFIPDNVQNGVLYLRSAHVLNESELVCYSPLPLFHSDRNIKWAEQKRWQINCCPSVFNVLFFLAASKIFFIFGFQLFDSDVSRFSFVLFCLYFSFLLFSQLLKYMV